MKSFDVLAKMGGSTAFKRMQVAILVLFSATAALISSACCGANDNITICFHLQGSNCGIGATDCLENREMTYTLSDLNGKKLFSRTETNWNAISFCHQYVKRVGGKIRYRMAIYCCDDSKLAYMVTGNASWSPHPCNAVADPYTQHVHIPVECKRIDGPC